MIFVPTILWTALVWACNSGDLFEHPFSSILPGNLALIASLLYGVYYMSIEPVAGVSIISAHVKKTAFAAILLVGCHYANIFLKTAESPNMTAAVIHIISWIMQILGHALAEGRAPAFLDNLFQAFVLAPLFVFLEFLFLFGYRPALQKKLKEKVSKAIKEWKTKKNITKKKSS